MWVDDFETIVIEGGLEADGHENFAQVGDTLIERHDGESVDAFRARAREAAVAAGSDRIVFGGLPTMIFNDEQSKGE